MTIDLLRDIRNFRVAVVHPKDTEMDELLRQLLRIGCEVSVHWPPPQERLTGVDLIFLDMTKLLSEQGKLSWSVDADGPPIIALLDYESPTVLEALVEHGARGFVGKPVRPFGLLTTMFLAHHAAAGAHRMQRRLAKAERRLDGLKKVAKAKAILMDSRRISEDEAYRLLRERAMARRTTIEAVASAVIDASEILSRESRYP
ncbi:AmiR/NasT family two-component response regulator [Azospirillum lipoferum]|uniref:ANTAR domain-containing protein n=1 Tax=Azospirillum lipoferum TaxID=193 RepID=A0A5A9GNK3_AZOLI|nr:MULTISPECIES: ANTAR domain-containing protein [Azospirillum]KAA0595960.1 ANTAR domain-containing protein [Azospirillum lipoferum]MCP1610857.1 AmiR/NasT family two-component response regulator [Azospirillum lipoferum]MDW5533995.1 ANTAR domain-containing protein [Azospirillum sp. NL1]